VRVVVAILAGLLAIGASRAAAAPAAAARDLWLWDHTDLTPTSAAAHLTAARSAANATKVDPYLLLYIAWHESRFNPRERTPESGGRESCGVMTPFPRARCARRSLADQYLIGAKHLRGWFDACRGNARCALLGYAGGYRLIRACRRGPMRRRRGRNVIDLCDTAWLYLHGAREIRHTVEGGAATATTESP